MNRLALVGAALFAAFTAWLSQWTLGLASTDGARLAVVPLSAWTIVIVLSAAVLIVCLSRAGASLLPVALLGFVLLPWLPCRIPAAFLVWAGPASIAVWVTVLVLMAASVANKPAYLLAAAKQPHSAALIACAVFSIAAWRAAPMVPGGDEPHYLIITQSLLLDGDLSIEDVHRRGDYRAYFGADLAPHVQRRGRDGQIYSVHAPGLPILVAPAFAIGGYHGVVVFLVLLASAGSALAWHLGWLATERSDAAWFAWASVTLPITSIFQSFTVYPDGPGGVLALTGLWALLRAEREQKNGSDRALPWLWHGIALALLPWLHSRFAVIAVCLGALILLRLSRTPNPAAKAVAFLSVPAVSAILWVGFFVAVYGTPDPSAPYASGELGSMRFVPGGLGGLLFDQRFGLLAYAPVAVVAFGGIGVMLADRSLRRLGLELLFAVGPYLLTVTHFAMWWGGWSPPARFFAPVLPLFAVPAALAWTRTRFRATRVVASGLLLLTILVSIIVVWVDRGRLAFNTRDAPALWLQWLSRVADLTAAAPMWARDTDLPLFRALLTWVATGSIGWLLLRFLERSGHVVERTRLRTAAAFVCALTIMTASSIVWELERSNGLTIVGSQMEVLNAVTSERRLVALQLDPFSIMQPADVPGRVRIEQTRVPDRRPGGRDMSPLFALPTLPAGHYRLTVAPEQARGWLMIGIARESRDPFALRTIQLPIHPIDLFFPVPVRALVVRGDEDAWRTVRSLLVEPSSLLATDARLTGDLARRAARYNRSTVYFLDDHSFPEPEAFWIGGGRQSAIVIQADNGQGNIVLRLRNAPVVNRVTLAAGGWRRVLDLQPGEEQEVEVPLQSTVRAALVRIETTAGFRPSEHDPASRDQRFLGVWMRVQ